MKRKILLLTVLILIISSSVLFAQENTKPDSTNDYIAGAAIAGIALMLFMVMHFGNKEASLAPVVNENKISLLARLKDKLSGAVPIEKEADIMLDHEFDGIRELNNSIPPWFNILFYGSVVIAFLYILNYHVFNLSPLQADEYNEEVKIATDQRNELIRTGAFINENTVKFMNDNTTLTDGKNIYNTNCSSCHGLSGGGLIGPNLTDENWIHGGGVVNVFKTIKYGVPIKGMISWQTQLNPKQIQAVANYILSLRGTNPPGAKQPEGEIYIDSTGIRKDSIQVISAVK